MKAILDSLRRSELEIYPILGRLGETTDLSADMHIEVDQVAFNVTAETDSVLIKVKRLTDARLLVKKVFLPLLTDSAKMEFLEKVLERMNVTVYAQNRYLGLIGPRANPILHWALRRFVAHAA